MKFVLKFAFLCCCLIISQSCGPTGGVGGSAASDTGGEAYVVVEAHSGRVLGGFNARGSRSVASLTKVATAMVVFDWAEATGTSLNTLAVVPPEAAYLGGSNPMGMQPGDQIQLRDGLYSMLLGSDNVAAQTLATHVGTMLAQRRGRLGEPVKIFVGEMNSLARALGMTRTQFYNAHGMELTGQLGRSSAEDMARLGIHAMRNSGFAFYVKQRSRAIGYLRGGQRVAFRVQNTHPMLGQLGINGIKEGQTPEAGPCLMVSADQSALVERLPDGRSRVTPRRLIAVILKSPNREGRANELIQTGWGRYEALSVPGAIAVTQPQEILSVPRL
ncbi:MAG: serine hydrolase [Verrucomicrobiota bacterium]